MIGTNSKIKAIGKKGSVSKPKPQPKPKESSTKNSRETKKTLIR